jgi:23S rRNA pseudouridine2605 synthase
VAGERLQKYLARLGLASRRQAEEWIRAGRVQVNGVVITELGTKVDPSRHVVRLDGRRVRAVGPPVTLMVHKPYGYVSTTKDPEGRRVVTELVPKSLGRLYPVGRLDYDATGLLLLTSDGDLAHRLTHPGYQVPRTYRVTVAGEPATGTLKALAVGVELDERPVAAGVQVVKRGTDKTVLELTVFEGRHHLIKRLMETVGHPVLKLKRLAFGPLRLGRLARGGCRVLTPEEIKALKIQVGLK